MRVRNLVSATGTADRLSDMTLRSDSDGWVFARVKPRLSRIDMLATAATRMCLWVNVIFAIAIARR